MPPALISHWELIKLEKFNIGNKKRPATLSESMFFKCFVVNFYWMFVVSAVKQRFVPKCLQIHFVKVNEVMMTQAFHPPDSPRVLIVDLPVWMSFFLLSCVDRLMTLQIPGLTEFLVTVATGINKASFLYGHVDGPQMPWLSESLVTVFTEELFSPGWLRHCCFESKSPKLSSLWSLQRGLSGVLTDTISCS